MSGSSAEGGAADLVLSDLLEADVKAAGFADDHFVNGPDLSVNSYGGVVTNCGERCEAAVAECDTVLVAVLVDASLCASRVEDRWDAASGGAWFGERDGTAEEVGVSSSCRSGHVFKDRHSVCLEALRELMRLSRADQSWRFGHSLRQRSSSEACDYFVIKLVV